MACRYNGVLYTFEKEGNSDEELNHNTLRQAQRTKACDSPHLKQEGGHRQGQIYWWIPRVTGLAWEQIVKGSRGHSMSVE